MPRRNSAARLPKRPVRAAVEDPTPRSGDYDGMARRLVQQGLAPKTVQDRRRLVVFEKASSDD